MPGPVSLVYGCCNREADTSPTLRVQDGWHPDGRRRTTEIANAFADARCRYVASQTDPRCTGCRERHADSP